MTSNTPVARNEPVSSDNLNTPGSDNPIFPKGICDAPKLQRFAQQALRGSGNKSSKRLVFPHLRIAYKRGKTTVAHDGKVVQGVGENYGRDIWRFLQRWGFRTLNHLHRAGYAPPDAEALAEVFDDYVTSHAVLHDDIMHRDGGGRGSLGLSKTYGLAQQAAEAALRDWSPDYNAEQAARSAKGGANSKRRPEWVKDPTLLDKLAKLDGKTIPQQAVELRVSPSTIKRMRAVLPEHLRRAADLSRELDRLFPKIGLDDND